MTKQRKMTDKDIASYNEAMRRSEWERKVGDHVTERLFALGTNYILRYGSDPYTMFKLYVDITRGIKYGIPA
jgi:hypothetical protein